MNDVKFVLFNEGSRGAPAAGERVWCLCVCVCVCHYGRLCQWLDDGNGNGEDIDFGGQIKRQMV